MRFASLSTLARYRPAMGAAVERASVIASHAASASRAASCAPGILRYKVEAKMGGGNTHVLHIEESKIQFPEKYEFSSENRRQEWIKAKDALAASVKVWVEANYPEYEDELAYWDQDFA